MVYWVRVIFVYCCGALLQKRGNMVLNDKQALRRELKDFLLVTVGSIIYAAGIGLFLDPARIAAGGVAGIAVVLGNFFGWDTGMLILVMNIPLFIIGGIRFKGKFLVYTIYSVFFSSWLIDLFALHLGAFIPLTNDLMLCSLAGGAIMSFGMSLVFLGGGATGGADIIVKLLRQVKPHLGTGTLFMIFDFCVALLSIVMFREVDLGLYAVVTLIVNAKVLDAVLYGDNEAKLLYIVSGKTEEVSNRLMEELEIGVTWLHGHGAYTQESRRVIFTVFRKQLYLQVREIVKSEDPSAFMIVTTATEIFGEGFRDHFADEI